MYLLPYIKAPRSLRMSHNLSFSVILRSAATNVSVTLHKSISLTQNDHNLSFSVILRSAATNVSVAVH